MSARGILCGVLALANAACGSGPKAETNGAPTTDVTDNVVVFQTIGAGINGNPAAQFGSIGPVRMGPDGSIFVLDRMAAAIRRFSPEGALLNSIGRRGSGPGEFNAPFAFEIDADTVFVWDAGLWRLTAFTLDGGSVRTTQIEPRAQSGWVPSIERTAQGNWLYLGQEIRSLGQEGVTLESGIIRGIARLMMWSPEQERWSTVGEFPGMQAAVISLGGHLGLANAPFPRLPLWTTAADGGYWYADNGDYRILRLGMAGDTLARIQTSLTGAPVTDADWERYVLGQTGDPSSPRARARNELRRPDRMPILTELIGAPNGDLWVRLHDVRSDSSEWHVYSVSGAPRFRLRVPANVDIRAIYGDTILAVARDSLDIQRVRVLGIMK